METPQELAAIALKRHGCTSIEIMPQETYYAGHLSKNFLTAISFIHPKHGELIALAYNDVIYICKHPAPKNAAEKWLWLGQCLANPSTLGMTATIEYFLSTAIALGQLEGTNKWAVCSDCGEVIVNSKDHEDCYE